MKATAGPGSGSTPRETADAPPLQVQLEGGYLAYKDFYRVRVDEVARFYDVAYARRASRNAVVRGFYWPSRRGAWRVQLLLLLLAAAHPFERSVSDLRHVLGELGVQGRDVRKMLHDLAKRGVVEHVTYGLYRLSDRYYQLLQTLMPWWPLLLDCLSRAAKRDDGEEPDKCLSAIMEIVAFYKIHVVGSAKVRESRGMSAKVTRGVTSKINMGSGKVKQGCRVVLDRLKSVLKRRRPSLYDELGGEIDLASEVIAVLYHRAKRGRAYVEAPRGRVALALSTLQDEARGLLGGSSSLSRVLDLDRVASLLGLLASTGLVFLRRYGPIYKIRLDKEFEGVLDEEGVCE